MNYFHWYSIDQSSESSTCLSNILSARVLPFDCTSIANTWSLILWLFISAFTCSCSIRIFSIWKIEQSLLVRVHWDNSFGWCLKKIIMKPMIFTYQNEDIHSWTKIWILLDFKNVKTSSCLFICGNERFVCIVWR